MKTVKKFNKVISIVAFILVLTSLLLTAILNNAVAYAESVNVEVAHEHSEHCEHSTIEIGENKVVITVDGTTTGDTTTDPALCPYCGCTIYGCSKCWTNLNAEGDVNESNGVVTYTNQCPGKTNADYVCPLDITQQDWYINMKQIVDVIDGFMLPILLVIGTAGSIFVIVLGVQFSKAESADKREEAKKRFINAIIGVVVTILLLILVKLFTANAGEIVKWINRA